jgi:hypothetical protein
MYAKRYSSETEYQVIHYFTSFPSGNLGEIVIPSNDPSYLSWLNAGGIPKIEAVGRFLSVVDNQLVVDPNKDSILAAEAAAAQVEADRIADKDLAIDTNLPSWSAVETAIGNISNLADAKAFLLKLSRVVYWDVKNKAD